MALPSTSFRVYSTHPNCRIIVDSCSCITTEYAERLGVDIVQFPFVMADGEHRADQWETITASEFYGRMRDGERAMTSAIPTGEFIELFEQCAADGIPTLYLSLTAGLSSSVHDAVQAVADVKSRHPEFELVALDNRTPSLSALLLTVEACKRRDAGATMLEIAEWARVAPDYVHGYFTLDSMRWLAAGGRIPKAAASIGAVLDVKPNLTYDLDGALTLTGISRGRKKAIKSIVSMLDSCYGEFPDRPIAIEDADSKADGDVLEAQVRAWFASKGIECPEVIRLTVDPTIGSHVGPGMIALAFWGNDRKTNGLSRGKR